MTHKCLKCGVKFKTKEDAKCGRCKAYHGTLTARTSGARAQPPSPPLSDDATDFLAALSKASDDTPITSASTDTSYSGGGGSFDGGGASGDWSSD